MSDQPDAAALRARNTVLGFCIFWCLLKAFDLSMGGSLTGLLFFGIVIALMYLMFEGQEWAELVLIGWFSLGALTLFGLLIWSLLKSPKVAYIPIVLGAVYAALPIYLIRSKDWQRYMEWRRGPSPTEGSQEP